MKKALFFIGIAILTLGAKAQIGNNAVVGEIKNDTGIVRISADMVYIELANDPSKRYAANDVDAKFKMEGTKVVFSGQIGAIQPNVRLMATPFKTTDIKVLEGTSSFKNQKMDFDWDKKISNVKATIQILSNGQTVVIVPDDNASQRYISQQLPAEYKKEGLKVTFNGIEGKIPPNVRMIGTPLKLTKIWVSKAEKKKYNLKKAKYCFK